MDRRKFISTTVKGSALLLAATNGLTALATEQAVSMPLSSLPVSKLKKPVAIAMWDYSWILRHHRYGEFDNWDKTLEELAERGYNAIRIDAMPQFIVSSKDGTITEEFRSIKNGWTPSLWGNDYTMSFRPREALVEFLNKCKKYKIRVGLSSWFLQHGTGQNAIFMEEDGLYRAWNETLAFLDSRHLLDDILYVDVLNEYPNNHGYDWLKNELNQRADAQKFKLNNPNANVPDPDRTNYKNNYLQIDFYNRFINNLLTRLKTQYPSLDFFASLDTGLADIDLSNFAALDYHVWFHHKGGIPGLDDLASVNQGNIDYRMTMKNLQSYWTDNKKALTEWMNGKMKDISQTAQKRGIVCGNTEGWGPIFWFDHPELDWSWVKESAETCIDLLQAYPNYKFICTSNFTHPHFKGLWADVKWHKNITNKINAI